MGYFLLFEGMLDSVLVARDKWLAPGGQMAPAYLEIRLAAIQDEDFLNERYHFWNDVYGFRMTSMQDSFMGEGQVDVAGLGAVVLGEEVCLSAIDTATVRAEELDFATPFTMPMLRAGTMTGFCGWFDTWFSGRPSEALAGQVFFSTSPTATTTHWKQTFFMLEEALSVCQGRHVCVCVCVCVSV